MVMNHIFPKIYCLAGKKRTNLNIIFIHKSIIKKREVKPVIEYLAWSCTVWITNNKYILTINIKYTILNTSLVNSTLVPKQVN